jgi:hypothetical protein
MSENLVPVVQLHPEEGVRERLDNRAFNLNGAVFLGHVLRTSLFGMARAEARSGGRTRRERQACLAWLTPTRRENREKRSWAGTCSRARTSHSDQLENQQMGR